YAECAEISAEQGWEKQSANDAVEQEAAKAMKEALEREDYVQLAELLALRAPMKDRKIPAGAAKDKHAFFLKLAREERDELKEISPDDLSRLEKESEYLSTQADALYRVLSVFADKYRLLKDAQGLLDYDDIMSVSYRLLQDESIAQEYREYYDYVFVDEYQDTNPIQEALISKIVRRDNAFMVGDNKQSIYRFSLADPLIFRERQQRYDNAEENGELLIRMNDNFRSAPEVIDGINRAMSRLMSRDFGEIDYTEDEALIAGRTDLSGETEFLLTTREDRSPSAAEEAESIAQRIAELHAEGIAYKDIAVLMRATKGDGDLFAQIFQQRGIPCINNAERSVPGEVELFLNLLRIVDNVNTDIPLIAVMRSYLVGFDEQELAEIRANVLHGSYYDAVKLTAENGETELGRRCAEFLDRIKLLRIYARSMPLKDFLILLKERTSFEERLILLPHGVEKADVFRRFYEDCLVNAEEKESLYHLLMYYDAILKRGESLVGKKETLGDHDCVQIMTVHKSKGLEFPVVFFARLGKRLRKDDAQNLIIYTSELGVVSDIYDETTRIRRRSLMRTVLSDLIEDQLRSEALRVVYVAMTRAKQRLILSGTLRKDKLDELTRQCIAAKRYGQLASLQTPLQWLIAAYSDEAFLDWKDLRITEYTDICAVQAEDVCATVGEVLDGCGCAAEKPLPVYQPDTSPMKYGVSALMPEYSFETSSAPQPVRSQNLGGTEFGSLVHYFMEHADFAAFEGVENQLGRMLGSSLITESEAQLLRKFTAQIESFFDGETAERIRRSSQVYREVPFNLSVSAKSVGKDAEGDVILQGIIDLLFEENEKWV
ncbi:MAG: UvrD-helicase domain-containing protein, partial [Christensenellaceae bacterium]|nr:UvrD-helicase domain-containing protein [Christensenellaceae bacterium]